MSMLSQGQELPRPAVVGIAIGTFFLTFFAAFWGFASAVNMGGTVQIIAYILIGLVTLLFFAIGSILMRYAHTLPETLSTEDVAAGKKIWFWFGVVFGIEFVLIALTSILLSTFQLSSFITPAIALIVGIHFFPLAHLFDVPAYYITGALLSALALFALIALLTGLQIAGPSPYNWSLFVGIGATLILWLTNLYIVWFGLRVMRMNRAASRA